MRFYVGSDHGGVSYRRMIVAFLKEAGHEVAAEDGPEEGESVDYPEVAQSLAARVAKDAGSFGVLVCGTGQGMAISANKVEGIRAGVAADVFSARMLREHNDANVLCVGERVLGVELAKAVVDAFAAASFAGGRHERRVAKINAMDRRKGGGA